MSAHDHLCELGRSGLRSGVIFFNNACYLGMCGHGAIGVAMTLVYLGRIGPGKHLLETPVGIVGIEYLGENRVTIENVPSYRFASQVAVDVEGYGTVRGDVVWGGNWFFLVGEHGQRLELAAQRGTDHSPISRGESPLRRRSPAKESPERTAKKIDHIELFGPPKSQTREQPGTLSFAPAEPMTARPAAPAPLPKLAWVWSPTRQAFA